MANQSENQTIQTHAAVRLRPTKQRWSADHLMTKRHFSIPNLAAYLLIAAFSARPRGEVLLETHKKSGVSLQTVSIVTDQLQRARLLVDENDLEHRWVQQLSRSWAHYGWREALDYHLSTFDYPFLDYGKAEAVIQDRNRMQHYRNLEPDHNRTKQYPNALKWIEVPSPKDSLAQLSAPFHEVWTEQSPAQPLPAERLGRLFGIVFGQIGSLRYPVSTGASDLLRKTSPSGGARHPTEAYTVVLDVPGMDPGWYHFAVGVNAFEKVAETSSERELKVLFPGPFRVPFPVRAVVLLTSLFERNMYRYREPRTFRVVFMDAGHLCATLETVAEALGLHCYLQHGLDDAGVERELGLHMLKEGALIAAALGGAGGGCNGSLQ